MTDLQIRRRVEETLLREPRIDSSKIGVTVKNGRVTLSGYVRTRSELELTEATVLALPHVSGATIELAIRPSEFEGEGATGAMA